MDQSVEKLDRLKGILRQMDKVLVAFSGGVDSTFLLKICKEVLGDKVVAITAASSTYSSQELRESKSIAKSLGVEHVVIETLEVEDERFTSNPPDRCYYCKKELFSRLLEVAHKQGLNYILDGSNTDDTRDYRPGSRAAEELHVRSPLREAGFTKNEIRELSRKMNLPTSDKPPEACLASRIPYGDRITREKLLQVEKAEEILRATGIRQVRVRHHGNIARIEIPLTDFQALLTKSTSSGLVREIKRLGYDYVTLDLEGYRTGSMNEPLKKQVANNSNEN
jgi:uncharacterized protein